MSGPCAGIWTVQIAVDLVIHLEVVEESVVCNHLVPERAEAVTSWKRVPELTAWALRRSASTVAGWEGILNLV